MYPGVKKELWRWFSVEMLQAFQLQMVSGCGRGIPPSNTGTLTQVINIVNPQKVRTTT